MTDDAATEDATVLDEVRKWHSQGEELQAKLLSEREVLVRKVKEIDDALALIARPPTITQPTVTEPVQFVAPSSEPVAKVDQGFPIRKLRGLSMPMMVRRIVEGHPTGITAKGVTDIVRQIMPKADPGLVHSGLYRGLEGNFIRSEGSRGSRLYFPVTANAAPETSDEKEGTM